MASNTRISVPETFPCILKTFVKDAMRTQPYDLLSWSAAYFRCIADDVQPPTKIRYEESTEEMIESRCLTKEYLKVLVKQIGKGYFVDRNVLHARWKSLSLHEHDLLKFLNVCGMIHWERIHWLELFATMVASICKDFPSSMDLLCELLTDETEGGSNAIPVWMFTICYTFLSQLDGTSNGESKANSTSKPFIEPAQINAQTFRKDLLKDWKACVKFSDEETIPLISVNFDCVKKAANFTEIIRALTEIQSSQGEGNNEDVMDSVDLKWKYEIIRRIGAPWNWIYQFVDHCSPSLRSYNFYECQHKLYATETIKNLEVPSLPVMHIPGIGPTVPSDITNEFIHFLNVKTRENDGMISPNVFTDENCPRMC